MTTLPVTLSDQTLIAMEKVKIASGDIESVFLKAEFDETWADFTARSASFHTSNNPTTHEELLIDNQCTIPADYLAQPGTLYVGIIGVKADGNAVKTSSVIGFKIVQGANHAYTTIKPKLDMYQQFLNAVKAEVDPITQMVKAELEAEYQSAKAKFLKPCDFSNTIHTISTNDEEWIASQDCWASLYVKGDNSFNATLSIDGVVVVSAEPYTSGSGRNAAFRMSPVYVRSGSTIGLTATSGKDASVNIYACISE